MHFFFFSYVHWQLACTKMRVKKSGPVRNWTQLVHHINIKIHCLACVAYSNPRMDWFFTLSYALLRWSLSSNIVTQRELMSSVPYKGFQLNGQILLNLTKLFFLGPKSFRFGRKLAKAFFFYSFSRNLFHFSKCWILRHTALAGTLLMRLFEGSIKTDILNPTYCLISKEHFGTKTIFISYSYQKLLDNLISNCLITLKINYHDMSRQSYWFVHKSIEDIKNNRIKAKFPVYYWLVWLYELIEFMSKIIFKHTLIFEKFWPYFTFLLITQSILP